MPQPAFGATTAGGLSVSVGYAEDKEFRTPNPADFPTPWAGSPHTTFLGGTVPGQTSCASLPTCYDAGAIRLDNPGSNPVTVNSVSVDDHSALVGGKAFNNLWGSFTVNPGQSVILTENPPTNNPSYDNFDTSQYPSQCTPVTVSPTVTLTVAGVPTTLVDSSHVLDTGGTDVGSCPPAHNESIQWRPIGAAGTDSATLTLAPSETTQFAGQTVTETAILLDGSGTGLPNSVVSFTVTSGPDAGATGTAVTDANGHASFSYTGEAEGEDVVSASVSTVGTLVSNTTQVMWSDDASSAWSGADIGNFSPAGSQTFDPSTGTWTVAGAGSDIAGTSDQFHFVSQTVPVNTGMAAHVLTQSSTSPGAKAGVMLRAGADPSAPYYGAFVTPSDGIVVQERGAENGSTTTLATVAGAVPAYLWVTQSGTTFNTYGSADGYVWAPIPGASVTLSLGSSVLAGLAVTSQATGELSTATIDTVVLSNSPPAPLPPEACPGPWTCADIGNPALTGSQSFDPNTGTWTVTAGGSDIAGSADQFHFVWQSMTGNGSVITNVSSQSDSNSNAKAGIMLRAGTDAGSPNYAVVVSPGAGIKVQVRTTDGGPTVKIANPAGTVPVYLEVTRSGNTFSAYTSPNGVTWTLVAGSSYAFNPGTTLLAGLAVTSHDTGVAGTATFDDVQVAGATPPPPPPPTITLVPASQSGLTGSPQTVTAVVLDGSGNPLPGSAVTFTVVSGPDAGQTATAVTDSTGNALFTDTSATAGTDTIQASFLDSTGVTRTSNQAQVTFGLPSSGGVVISNLSVYDTSRASEWSVQQNLQVGDVLYSDRSYTLTAAPSLVLGAEWIQDTNGSKSFTGNPLVAFTVNQSATVFVGMDRRLGRPSWLDSTWTDTGLTETGTGPVTYELFEKTFPAGPVTLGPVGPTSDSMYTIAVQ